MARTLGERAAWFVGGVLLTALGGLVGTPAAKAQPAGAEVEPVETSRREEPLGIKVGDGRLHLYVQLDTHYVYNPTGIPLSGAGQGAVVNNPPANDLFFALRPGMELRYPGSLVDLRFDADFAWNQYAGLENEDLRGIGTLSGTGLSGINAAAKLGALFNKSGSYVVDVGYEIVRSEQPASEADSTTLKHLTNRAGLTFDAKPGGGALIFTLGYDFFYDYYDRNPVQGPPTNNSVAPELLDNLRHTPRLKIAWKFLPKTVLFAESNLMFTQYPIQAPFDSNLALTGTPESFILASALGANGSITPRISAIIKAGYTHIFAVTGDVPAPSALAEVNFALTELAKFRVGYARSAKPTTIFGWFVIDQGYIGYDHLIAGLVQLQADLGFSYLDFGPQPTSALVTGTRRDYLGTVKVGADFFVTDWLVLGLFERFEYRQPTFDGTATSAIVRNDFFFRAAVRY